MKYYYREKLFRKLLMFVLAQVGLILVMMLPFLPDYALLHFIPPLLIAVIFIFDIYLMKVRPAVLVISEDGIKLSGLRPGFYKLVQFWHQEFIPADDIVSIRCGKIREDFGWGIKLPPLSVPSNQARAYKFLWVKYRNVGEILDLYYPHTPEIENFEDALVKLQQLAGNKLAISA
jgi:hypothetical protein